MTFVIRDYTITLDNKTFVGYVNGTKYVQAESKLELCSKMEKVLVNRFELSKTELKEYQKNVDLFLR